MQRLKLVLTMSAPDQEGVGTTMYRTILWPVVPQLGTKFPANAKYDSIGSLHEVIGVEHDFNSGCIWVSLDTQGTLSEDDVKRLLAKRWVRSSVLDGSKMSWESGAAMPIWN